jgi:hypothetical protein
MQFPAVQRFRRRLFITFVAVCSLTAIAWLSAVRGQVAGPPTSISICGSSIDVHFIGETSTVSHNDLVSWVHRAGDAVCTYYGHFPVPHLSLDVRVRGGPGVHGGVTYPSSGGYISITLGAGTTVAQLDDDWMLTHEMIHLAFPSMARDHHWIEEGISVYVEPVARVQERQLAAERMWRDVARDMPQGEPATGDEGLDHTPTWGRTYWGGAMFCLVADVRIREQTHNQKGLQNALRGILAAGGNITQDWNIERAFAVGDKATATTVLADLYQEMRDKPDPIDLATLWKELGVQRQKDGSIQLDASAPDAEIRDAITRPRSVARQEKP